MGMKNDQDQDQVGTGEGADWLEVMAMARPTPVEIARRRRELAGRPKELQRLDQELALNALLDARPRAPRAATNFAAVVQQRIMAEDRLAEATRKRVPMRWWHWVLGGHPAWSMAAMLVVGLTLGGVWLNRSHRAQMAASVATVALTASAPGLSADSLENYEIIRRLDTAALPGDDALIAALVERGAQ